MIKFQLSEKNVQYFKTVTVKYCLLQDFYKNSSLVSYSVNSAAYSTNFPTPQSVTRGIFFKDFACHHAYGVILLICSLEKSQSTWISNYYYTNLMSDQ